MGFFSALFGLNDNSSNYNGSPLRNEPTSEDYIRSGEIEEGNYDESQRNYIDEHGELPED